MVALSDDLARIAASALELAGPAEELAAVLAAEPHGVSRVYLCAFRDGSGRVAWLALDDAETAVESRALVRESASIVAMCELAAEHAGGGKLEELRARLVALRLTEAPQGVEEAETAALALEQAVGTPPRVASPGYLDLVGAATRQLEVALGEDGPSPFAQSLRRGVDAVELFAKDVEAGYKLPLR